MTLRRQAGLLALLIASAIVAVTSRVRTDDPVSSSVRFTGEIVRIFDRKCQPCHGTDRLAMPLANYRDVRAWGRAIREEIVEQRMPPWSAARGYGRFRNDLSLSARETITVLSWIDGGMPRGDDKDLPAAPSPATVPAPDLRVALPAQRIPALDDDVVRPVTIALRGLDPARTIARVALVPGAPQVVRGALIYEGEGDRRRWIGAWLPWQRETAPPDGHGFQLAPSAQLTVELHYRGADAEAIDNSSIEIFYTPRQGRQVDELTVRAAAPSRLSRAATAWAIVPAAGTVARSFQLTARRPDGSTEVLLWVPQVNRQWPQALVLESPIGLPAGTELSVVTHPADTAAGARISVLR